MEYQRSLSSDDLEEELAGEETPEAQLQALVTSCVNLLQSIRLVKKQTYFI